MGDNAGIREGVRAIINSQPDMALVGEALTREAAMEQFRTLLPNVTIIDVNHPVTPGDETSQAILSAFPEARIIVITALEGDDCIRRAFEMGVRAVLYKDTLRRELLPAIRAVHEGQHYVPDEIAARLNPEPLDNRGGVITFPFQFWIGGRGRPQ